MKPSIPFAFGGVLSLGELTAIADTAEDLRDLPVIAIGLLGVIFVIFFGKLETN
jgi:hypothetical protein